MKDKRVLLVVEDDPGLQSQLRWCFDGFDVVVAGDRDDALAQLRRYEPSVVTLDLGLPPDPGGVSEGMQALEQILKLAPHTKVIVITGNDGRENAVRAVGLGAYDFYQKPIDGDLIKMIVERAHRLYELELENRRLHSAEGQQSMGIIADSEQMQRVCRTVEKLAPTDVTVMLLGESGTGKELLARALHNLSPRSEHRFVAINCAAIPDNLLESELFGYEKGAFTGANKQTLGKIEHANAGTFFLDEVGDLPLALQAKLLRFLQERVIERLGGRGEIPIDVRVVGATHRDLQAMVKTGDFREDLYYRLAEVAIDVPPLRERNGDAVLITRALLKKISQSQSLAYKELSSAAVTAIESYAWPGNVREIENKVKRALVMSEGRHIAPDDLDLPLGEEIDMPFNLRQVREKAEMEAVSRALAKYNKNVAQAAESLGVSRPTLYHLMEKYNLSR